MRKTITILGILILVQLTISSCSQSSPIVWDSDYLNQQITLSSIQSRALTTKEPIFLVLTSNSDADIIFPSNFNLRIFVRQNNDWIEINEWPVQRPDVDITMSPTSNSLQIISFQPQLENESQQNQIRVYVFGEMKTEKGDISVAAYTDVTLFP